jgi:hypothetical protein
MGATVITQGGNTANVTANNNLQVELHNGASTVSLTGTSLNVNVTNGGSGSSLTDNTAFTQGTTAFTVGGCEYNTSITNLTTGNAGAFQCSTDRNLYVNLNKWANTALGVPTNFGTTPGAVIAGSVNASLFAGTVAVSTAASGVVKVGIVGNAGGAFDAVIGAAPPANALQIAGLGSGATGGFLIAPPVADSVADVNISTATTTLIVTGVAGRQVRIGAWHLTTAGADNVAWIEGTGATCGTGTAGMAGGTTAASGYNFLANGSMAQGTGFGTVLRTITAGDSVCLVTSATVQLSGQVDYTIY